MMSAAGEKSSGNEIASPNVSRDVDDLIFGCSTYVAVIKIAVTIILRLMNVIQKLTFRGLRRLILLAELAVEVGVADECDRQSDDDADAKHQ